MAVVPKKHQQTKRIYEGSRIPSPVPTILEVDPAKHSLDDILRINFGPNHPSTHGVLRLVVDLDGEAVAGIYAVIGYLHTGFEKNMEAKTWWKNVTYAPRVDYLSFQANELVYVLAVEKLLGLEVPRRATWVRMALTELNRIHSHLIWLGTSALEIGAIFDRNAIWLERTKGIGLLSAEDALALGQSGPILRASGVDWDLRRQMPYLFYDQVEFDVPVYENGDVYDRYKVHMDEMRESIRIVRQCLDKIEETEG